jgi:hypothetical protein
LITALANLQTARSQLAQAQTNEKRAHDLYLAQGGALKDWQQAQTDLITSQNTVRADEIALAAVRNRLRILGKSDKEIASLEARPTQKLDPVTIVTAPIGGIITRRQIGLGQYINSMSGGASNPVHTIGNLSTVWLIANVRETDAPLMHVGQPVELRVLAFPGRVFKAKISWVAPSIDSNTHRLSVRADVENPQAELKPGMFANFSIIRARPRPPRLCRSARSSTKAIRLASGWQRMTERLPPVPSASARLSTGWSRSFGAYPPARTSWPAARCSSTAPPATTERAGSMNAVIAFALRQRVLMVLLLLFMFGVGIVSFLKLNIEAYPDPVPPLVDINTLNPGQSAEEIERYITIPIEIQMAGIPHVTAVRAISLFGLSDVKVQFTYAFTYDDAQQWVINRLSQLGPLPNGATP